MKTRRKAHLDIHSHNFTNQHITMSNFPSEGDQPLGAPTKGAATPWLYKLEYKSGKIASGYADIATPERAKAGLSYYDKEASERKTITSELTLCIVAVLTGVSGTTKDSRDNYTNYSSNLVRDTRTDVLNVYIQGIPTPQFTGKYQKAASSNEAATVGGKYLPQGVGYTKYLICWCPELEQIVSVELTVGLGIAIENAIAESCGKKRKDISLFNLCELAQFWVLKIAAEFEKKDKDGNDYAGDGDMYFIPKMRAFVITESGNNPELYADLCQMSEQVSSYLEDRQRRIKSFGEQSNPDEQTDPGNFPTTAPPQMEDNDKSVADDIPSMRDKFFILLASRFDKLQDPITIIYGLSLLYKEVSKPDLLKKYGVSIEEIASEFTKHYRIVTGDETGVFDGGKIIPGIPETGDLPF